MKSARFSFRRGGFALVSVLAIIIVLTIVIVAFVTQSRLELASSASFSNTVAANKLSHQASDNIIAGLLSEMEAGSSNVSHYGADSAYAYYDPRTRADIAPKKDSFATANTTNAPTLLRSSGPQEFYPGAGDAVAKASDVRTDQPSAEGRSISAERWNLPEFIAAAQAASVVPPNWVYVTRCGPVTNSASYNPAYGRSFENGELNLSYIIGRYAYRIYDVSGLIDVNVAGYPNGTSASRVGRKGGLPWGTFTNGVEKIADWRWPAAAAPAFTNYTDVSASVAGAGLGPRSGYLLMPTNLTPSPNRFLTRGDLLTFLKSETAAAQGLGTNLAPQLTVFSREVTVPAGIGDARPNASGEKILNPRPVASVRITTELDNANQPPGKRRDGTAATVGEPLVTRFPLSKISLLSRENPTAQEASDIEAWFGLRKRSDGKWDYLHGSGMAGSLPCLKSLAAVAAEGREPDFFEMLQAGILTDSLGQSARSSPVAQEANLVEARDTSLARHVLRLGLNIIDQYDGDDEPTVIARHDLNDADPDLRVTDPDISGVERTPLIQVVGKAYYRSRDPNWTDPDGIRPAIIVDTTPKGDVRSYPRIVSKLQFQLWNPHDSREGTATGNYRIVASGEAQLSVKNPPAVLPSGYKDPRKKYTFSPASDSISFSTGAGQTFASPALLTTTNATLSSSQSNQPDSASNVFGFYCGEAYAPYHGLKPADVPDDPNDQSHRVYYELSGADAVKIAVAFPTPLLLQLQKQNSAGQWLPLQTLALTGGGNSARNLKLVPEDSDAYAVGPYLGDHYLNVDPRTNRFGSLEQLSGPLAASAGGDVVNQNFPKNKLYSIKTWSTGVTGANPDPNGTGTGTALPIGNLADGRSSAGAYYSDRGTGIIRHADDPAEDPFTDNNARPVILNRPFKSVAEITYAFRDQAWRTISFSQDNATAGAAPADSVLLDLFTVQPEPSLRSGVINLNTASQTALRALIASTDLSDGRPELSKAQLSASQADQLAEAIYDYVRQSSDHLLRTPADIGLMVKELSATAAFSKRQREALVAALAEAHNARTWNLVLDVIAQTGKMSQRATGFENFHVSGETRMLVHLAIDRYTGEIVDQAVEPIAQ